MPNAHPLPGVTHSHGWSAQRNYEHRAPSRTFEIRPGVRLWGHVSPSAGEAADDHRRPGGLRPQRRQVRSLLRGRWGLLASRRTPPVRPGHRSSPSRFAGSDTTASPSGSSSPLRHSHPPSTVIPLLWALRRNRVGASRNARTEVTSPPNGGSHAMGGRSATANRSKERYTRRSRSRPWYRWD